uniref:JmjC domain-containing protein n=1 Tax=viral metagenome TaxID=1070528 RepID=A0A6C0D919_9ZZZZ
MKIIYIIILLLIILLINNLFQTNNDNNFEDTNNIIFREDIYTNNCKKISIDNYKDIYINLNNIEPIIFKVKNIITKDFFIKKIENFKLDFSVLGNSDVVINSILYKDYLNNNNNNEYIFHSLFLNPNYVRNINKFKENYKFVDIIIKMIDIPYSKSINNLERCDLFIGKKYTGTHLHNHLEAINYLVYGKKLWLIFPDSKKNIKYIKSITSYPNKTKTNAIDWLNINYNKLKKNIEDLYIFIQKDKECVYIPLYYFHMVINLEDSGGIAYNFS